MLGNAEYFTKILAIDAYVCYNKEKFKLYVATIIRSDHHERSRILIFIARKERAMKAYELFYLSEAPFGGEDRYIYAHGRTPELDDDGWEKWSLPIGNGYMGANVFGRTQTERIQITENSFSNPCVPARENDGCYAGLNNFCELYLDIGHPHDRVTDYKRSLSLNTALARTEYSYEGVQYRRTVFASYPDKVLVCRLECSKQGALSFAVRPEFAGLGDHLLKQGDGMGKTVEVSVEGDTIRFFGELTYYKIQYEGQIAVLAEGGQAVAGEKGIEVRNANAATLILAVGTNYRLESRVFFEKDPKRKLAPYPHPHERVSAALEAAKALSYRQLVDRHLADYCPIIERASIDLGGVPSEIPTDRLLERYRSGKRDRYLEELYFTYGRYLLIASSRPDTYPANLQGTWNKYLSCAWSSGYWHNINVQMNYWPAFNTNLFEMFTPYMDYFKAYKPYAEQLASDYVQRYFPERYSEGQGQNGFVIGTSAWLYDIYGIPAPASGHSGPGTGAFTTKLFADYYDFSMDEQSLETVYEANLSMARFLHKTLETQEDGKLLVKYSESPEQMHGGGFYHTKGCAFDQQMIWECFTDTVKYADALGVKDEFIEQLRADVKRLDPVQVGCSGQIKEYREEQNYGDIGEYHHRHISHLVGLYPGTVINGNTPDWLKAAAYSLNERGDVSTGWSTGHKMNAWARIKNGDRAYELFRSLLENRTLPNLWDTHPPFQIDGNFGATAGMAEMLIQSHEGYIHLLPALPSEWKDGSFDGLTARGGYVVSASWKNGKLLSFTVTSKSDGEVKIRINGREDILARVEKGRTLYIRNE